MKARKKRDGKGTTLMIVTMVVLLLSVVCMLFYLGYKRNRLNAYQSELFSVTSGSYMVKGEYDGVRVLLSDESVKQLGYMSYYAKVSPKKGKAEVLDEVKFFFKDRKEKYLTVYQRTDNKIEFVFETGEETYHTIVDDDGNFDIFVQLASPEGWKTPNKIVKR